MMKILFTLSIVILFFSCKTQNRKTKVLSELPENTTFLTIHPQTLIPSIESKLDENSGIIYYANLFWTFNDSGGENVIYAVNRLGKIVKEIEIENSKNIDWEDITQDNKHIYIGDFGNNNGVRSNLRIYKINKKDIGKSAKQKVKAEKIDFVYGNQKDFSFSGQSTAFDCEALIEFNKNLYLFTKDWANRTTTVYQFSRKKGEYILQPQKTLNVRGLITGADISPDKKKLALVGYKNYKPIAWIFTDFEDDDFFSGKRFYMEMDEIYDAQTEGICFVGNDTLAISCEQTRTFNQQVFGIDLSEIK